VAKVESSSLLGGNVINITVETEGQSQGLLQDGDEITTAKSAGIEEAIAEISEISEEAQDLISSLNEGQKNTLGKLEAVIDENRDYLRETSESFARVGPKLEVLADDLTEMTAQIKGGEGSIGRLYSDPQLYDDLREIADTAKEV